MLEATEYYVAVNHPNATDSNDGLSLDQPFKTLDRAATPLSPGDTLSIKAGIYREALVLGTDGTVGSPVVVRAYPGDEGEVVIRGSDVVKGWTNDGGGVWSVFWQPLPLLDYPDGYPDVDEYARRREIVFVEGNPLKQVLSGADLVSGHFWMDDAAQRMRIHYSGDPNASQVEISVRTRGVNARGRSYLVFRGLRVEHVSTDIWIGAMALGPNIRVEDCRVEYNNQVGIVPASDSVIIRTTSNFNGRMGIGLSGSNSLIDSSETSYNGWRYGRWAAGGIKVVSTGTASGNQIVRHTAKHNNGPGIAFDTVGSGNVVEASFFEGNRREIIFEAAIGPNWIINNVVVITVAHWFVRGELIGHGIRVFTSRDTYIYNNTIIVDVNGTGIYIGGGERYTDTLHFYSANTRVFNNIFAVNPGQRLIHLDGDGLSATEEMLASHQFDNNLYFGADSVIWFREAFSLAEWQTTRGKDLNSLSAPPMFTNPTSHEYSLQTGSLAIDGGQDLAKVTEDFTGTPRPQGLRTDIGAFESLASPVSVRRPPTRRLNP
ncbi:hypothetical protein N9980_01425 [bacterium]|nr:hypothetical protein [bacterium]